MEITAYLQTLDSWMTYWSFERNELPEGLDVDRMFYRGRVEGTKFGKVDTYAFVKAVPDNIDVNYANTYSRGLFNYAMRIRTGAPLGFGAMLVVYPMLIVDNISSELYNWIQNYCPKHFAAAEFPSILNLSSGDIYYYPKTPIWGALYYSDYRNQTLQCFSPKKWTELSGKG
jgi:hypothetical protein